MTNQDINIAIAECCGAKWYVVTTADGTPARSLSLERKEWWTETHDMSLEHLQLHMLPNFCEDLNAMWGAEETLIGNMKLWIDYYHNLMDITRTDYETTWHATARQRAEAFLRVKGLWKE